MQITKYILLILSGWLITGAFIVHGQNVTVLSQNTSALTLHFQFDKPEIEINDTPEGSNTVQSQLPGLQLRMNDGLPVVPFMSKIISLQGKDPVYKIKSAQESSINLNPGQSYQIFGNNAESFGGDDQPVVELTYQGLFRDIPIYAVSVFPVRYDPQTHSIKYFTHLIIEISDPAGITGPTQTRMDAFNDKKLNSKLILNDDYKSILLEKPTSSLAQDNQRYKAERYKIFIKETGLYQVTYSDLLNNGISVQQIDTRLLKLYNRGAEIPLYFKGGQDGSFDSGDYFEFWGEINRSAVTGQHPDIHNDPFSDLNVYWLETGNTTGLRMVEESGSLNETNPARYIRPYAFTEKLHFEKDNSFVRFGHQTADIDSPGYTMDHWFFDRGVSAIGSKSYPAEIIWPFTQIGSRSVFVKAMMRGLSEASTSNPLENHQVDIWLNDEKVGTSGSWKDQELHFVSNHGQLGLSQNGLKHGENQFRVIMDQPGVTDIAILNWFEITYQRKYRAYKNIIEFKRQDNLPAGYILQFEIDGFTDSNIDLYKIGISKIVNNRIDFITADDNQSSYRLSFQDEIFSPDIKYVAITQSAKKKPMKIIADHPWKGESVSSLFDNTNRAEYLIITDQLFYANAQKLKSYREANGLAVEVVKAEDIYDEFNFGIKSPLAIKKFLSYAYNNWDSTKRLLYVVLVGSASFDYRSQQGAKIDYVPTFLYETVKYGAAGSDYPYALISGNDIIPDLIVSRIPAKSNSEFEAYLDKLAGYESPENIGEWRNKGLFISGNDASTKEVFSGQPAFRAQNQRIIDMRVPDGFFTRKINTIREDEGQVFDPNFGGTIDLIDYFDDGLNLINFYGHGGGGIWADVQLMNTGDVDRLNEQYRLPFVQSMTCFTGAYENGGINGLADKLLLAPKKGAIGVIAASGVGWLYNDFALGWNLTGFLMESDLTVGEAVLLGKIMYISNNNYVADLYDTSVPSYPTLKSSMVHHYNLLGDPYIKLSIPEKSISIKLSNSLPASGDTILVSLKAPFLQGSGRAELANAKHEVVGERFFNLVNGTSDINLPIPAGLPDQNLYLKAFAENVDGYSDARGIERLSVNRSFIDSIVTSPRTPEIGNQIGFSVYVKSSKPIFSIRIEDIRSSNGVVVDLNLTRINDSLWVYDQGFGAYNAADVIYYDILLTDSTGNNYLFRHNVLTITDPRPDLAVDENSVLFGGTEQMELIFTVKNQTSQSFTDVDVDVFLNNYSGGEVPIFTKKINLTSFEEAEISVPVAIENQQTGHNFVIVVDRNGSITERDEKNNIRSATLPENIKFVSNKTGTSIDGVTNDTIQVASAGRINYQPGAVSPSTVLQYSFVKFDLTTSSESQPGFKYVHFQEENDSKILVIDISNPMTEVTKPGYFEIILDTSSYSLPDLDKIYLCRFNPEIGRWVKMDSHRESNNLVTGLAHSGQYALFLVNDSKEPVIEVTVNGRTLTERMYVPTSPNLALILQDENGIDLTRGFQVRIDEIPVTGENLVMPDSVPNANAVSILTTPKIEPGFHSLTVQVTDVNGNVATKKTDFQVASEFDLRIFGNYPNPFEDETIISFEIISDGILDEFSVKIYTISGRKIREIIRNTEYPDEIWVPGYHEVKWDGLDSDGALVANGVYFAIVSGKYKGKNIEQTLKLAKLK